MNIGTNVTGITIPEGAAKNIKRGTEMLWQDGGLPTAFQRCEYIESHGTEWIDTKFIPTLQNSVDVFCEFELVRYANNYDYIFGVYSNGTRFSLGLAKSYSNIYPGFMSMNSIGVTPKYVTGVKYTLYMDSSHFSVFGVTGNFTTHSEKDPIVSPVLFALRNASGSNPFIEQQTAAKIYSFVYNDLILSNCRNFIPCYLKQAWNGIPAGTIGLYDLCGSLSSNGTPFYTNEGTGTFTKGADVV